MILGMPSGSRRMPAVASEVPPEPPAEMTPPIPRSRSIQRPKASAMAVTESPRSPEKTALEPLGCIAATCIGVTSAREILPEVERSTVRTGMFSARSRSRMKRNSALLVSKVPTTKAVRPTRSAKGMVKTGERAALSSASTAGAGLRGACATPQRLGSLSAR